MLNWSCQASYVVVVGIDDVDENEEKHRENEKQEEQNKKKRPFHPEDEIEHMRTGYFVSVCVSVFFLSCSEFEIRNPKNT